jgi:pimeloyl-ACP methyl ester carboxylesterase
MTALSDNPRIARLYKDVPEAQLQRLLDFRARCPYQTVEINGRLWRYLDCGEGDQVLLILAGGTTVAEISFNTLEHLMQKYRVIAPDYPPVDTLKELFAGYIEMLDRLGIGQFVLMGGSYGGWLAQSFVRLYPDRVQKMVLAAIGPPNPENSRQLARLMGLFRLMPAFLLRALMNRSLARLVKEGSDGPQLLLMQAQLREIMLFQVGRADILAALRRLIDQTTNYTFSPDDLKDWPGRILALMGSEDPATPPDKQEAMRQLYPQADIRVFEGADHTVSVSHQHEYYGAIDAFLAQ